MPSAPFVNPSSAYLHIPFCRRRCAYCDFNTYAGREALISSYVAALCREIETVGQAAPVRLTLHTIYFGGGTPSLLSPSQCERILTTLRQHYALAEETEITLEANPGTLSRAVLAALHHLGINRLSLGMQSAHTAELERLGRTHTLAEVVESVRWAREAGFHNLNLDLIYGLPQQSLTQWQTTVQQAVALAPEHLSLYALTVEPHTPLGRQIERGLLPPPDPDLAATMYEWASDYLERHGYAQYEISNWSRPGFACRHNLTYWRDQPYLGFGAGAHGYVNRYRCMNVLRIPAYIQRLSEAGQKTLPFPFSAATVRRSTVSRHTAMQETMMLGLRLTGEGVVEDAFRQRFGVTMSRIFGVEIEELLRLGLVEWAQDEKTGYRRALRLTRRGRLLGNQAFLRFVNA
jgi:oxygen-independent coproporphyrinogen-3 oxidase